MRTLQNEPTGAVYGFISRMESLIEELRPDRLVVAFDSKEKNFRRELYPEYKAKRLLPPEELIQQLPAIREYLAGRGIHSLEKPGLEGDDIIALLARRFAAAGAEVLIFSADKDLFQLVGDRVAIFHPKLKKKLGRADVKEFFGVFPEQIVDYLVLAGDASDNIPGIPGIGEKTATKLIEKFGSLAAMLQRPGPGRRQAAGKDNGQHGPVRAVAPAARFRAHPGRGPRPARCRPFEPAQRRTPARALPPPAVQQPAEEDGRRRCGRSGTPPAPPVAPGRDAGAAEGAGRRRSRAAGSFAWDIETTAIEFFKAEIVGITLVVAGHGYYVPFLFPAGRRRHAPAWRFAEFKKRDGRTSSATPRIRKTGHNLKFDMLHLLAPGHAGRRRRARHHDHVLPPLSQPPLPPAEGAERRIPGRAPDHLRGTGRQGQGPGARSPRWTSSGSASYCVADADCSWQLVEKLLPQLRGKEAAGACTATIEMPLVAGAAGDGVARHRRRPRLPEGGGRAACASRSPPPKRRSRSWRAMNST